MVVVALLLVDLLLSRRFPVVFAAVALQEPVVDVVCEMFLQSCGDCRNISSESGSGVSMNAVDASGLVVW